MKLPRRKFLRLAAGVAVLPAVARIAAAQTYPSPLGGRKATVRPSLGQG